MAAQLTPLVSVIIPSFNQGKFIAETIDSILSQDYRPVEILVLDGASTDETLSVLEKFRHFAEVNIWSEADKGVVDAVNKGLAKARGEILAIQSSDDTYLPGAIKAAVECLIANPDAGLVYGNVEYIDERSRVTSRDLLPPFSLADYFGRLTYVPQPTAFFRASAARATGTWSQEVSYAADADYWLRIALCHGVVRIDRMMGRYRYHEEQRDKHSKRILRDWERMMDALIAHPLVTPPLARAARMGVHLARYRYTPESQWAARSKHLYRAALSNPRAVRDRRFPKREFVVGRAPIWAFLSRVKRALGFRPRVR